MKNPERKTWTEIHIPLPRKIKKSDTIPDRPSSSTPGTPRRNSEKKPLTPLLPSSKPQPLTYPWGQMDGRGIERLKEQGGKRPREYSHSVKSRSEPLVGENERTSTYPHLKGARPGPLRSKWIEIITSNWLFALSCCVLLFHTTS
jgi:hypothetical protein